MSWTQAAPGLLAMVVVMVAPGWLMLRALGLRGLVALGPAATLTFAVSAGWAVVLGAAGIDWNLATFLLGMLLAAGVCALLGDRLGTAPWRDPEPVGVTERAGPAPRLRWLRPADAARRARDERARSTALLSVRGALLQPPPMSRPLLLLLAAALVLATGLHMAAMTRGIGVPDRPSQVWDGVFHLSAVQAVREHGDASSFGGLGSLYDYGYAPFYPSGWHGVVAVTPFLASVPMAVNVSILVVGLLWSLSTVGLVRATWPELPVAAAVAPVLAHSFVTLPVALITQMGQFPFTYAHVLLPGVLTLVVLAVRNLPDLRGSTAVALPAVVGALGLALVHGSAWFSILVLAGPLLAAAAVGAFRRLRHDGLRLPLAVAGWSAAGLALLLTVPLLAGDVVDSVQAFDRPGDDGYGWILTSLLVDRPLRSFGGYGAGGTAALGQVLVTGLAIGGALAVWWRHRGRWLAVGLVVAVGLTALAHGPADHPLRWLTSFWYSEAMRLDALVVICAAPLAALGLAVLVREGLPLLRDGVARLRRSVPVGETGPRRRAVWEAALAAVLVAVVVLASDGLRYTLRTYHAVESFVPDHLPFRMLAGDAELELFRRAGETLPQDAVVLGDRFRGTPYFYSLGGVDVVYPHLAGPRSADGQLLQARFDEIGTDPEVCAAVERLGVTHFYTNTRETGGDPWDQMDPLGSDTLFTFRPGEGFELVDTGGTGQLWEIHVCDAGG